MKPYAVTETFHGSIVYATTEGAARRAFHQKYNGESITHIWCFAAVRRLEAIGGKAGLSVFNFSI